jgi:hypothetical protein
MVEERLEQLTGALLAAEAFLAEATLQRGGMVAGVMRDYTTDALELVLPALVVAVREYVDMIEESRGEG